MLSTSVRGLVQFVRVLRKPHADPISPLCAI
jgi:hypothetical protein